MSNTDFFFGPEHYGSIFFSREIRVLVLVLLRMDKMQNNFHRAKNAKQWFIADVNKIFSLV